MVCFIRKRSNDFDVQDDDPVKEASLGGIGKWGQTLRDPHKSTLGSEDKWGQTTFRKHSENVV